ncbi:hypothetical protein [Oceanobacillus rekensis]|uniref:hypothetical protein n=1 Tax=Oceanobacillus rekensis TaxID=937927 RepID=UPI000B438E88|nr:hypothetical protein [Oceanobacillus rekensis]
MGRQLKGLIYFFITDVQYSLKIFWTILLSILVVCLSFSYILLRFEESFFIFFITIPIYIYCSILGFLTVKESIPFSLKIGSVRKNLFISIGIFFLGVALVNAIAANTLHTVTILFTDMIGLDNFSFLHVAQLLEDTWLNRVMIDTVIMFFLLSFMFIIGLLFYKYGLLGGGAVIGLIAVGLLFGVAKGWIVDYFINLYQTIDMFYFLQIFVAGLVIYCISYVFLRRVTTVKAK